MDLIQFEPDNLWSSFGKQILSKTIFVGKNYYITINLLILKIQNGNLVRS